MSPRNRSRGKIGVERIYRVENRQYRTPGPAALALAHVLARRVMFRHYPDADWSDPPSATAEVREWEDRFSACYQRAYRRVLPGLRRILVSDVPHEWPESAEITAFAKKLKFGGKPIDESVVPHLVNTICMFLLEWADGTLED